MQTVCSRCREPIEFSALTEAQLEAMRTEQGPRLRPWIHTATGRRDCYPACSICGERPAQYATVAVVADGGGGTRTDVKAWFCGSCAPRDTIRHL